jgi:hypothetical protein
MYPGNRPRRWLRWLLVYCASVLAVMVTGLVIEAAVSPGAKQPQDLSPKVPTPPWASTPAPRPTSTPGESSGTPALAGPVQLLPGREQVNGVALGFPQSTVGAVSAAADTAGEVFSTLDPDRAAAVMRMTADPSYASAPLQAAQGANSDRQSFGIPASGPVPPGYSLLVQPVEYQVRDDTADRVTVLLLCDATTSRPGQGTQTRVAVFPLQMHWAQADWKVASVGTDSYASLAAEPFSPRAAALGWQELLPQEAASAS